MVFRPFNTVGALERAKLAVEKHYSVVGVLEDVNATLTVLENYIPKFFRGATNAYWGKAFASSCWALNNRMRSPIALQAIAIYIRGQYITRCFHLQTLTFQINSLFKVRYLNTTSSDE